MAVPEDDPNAPNLRRANIPVNPEGKKFTDVFPAATADQLPKDMREPWMEKETGQEIPSTLDKDELDMLNRPIEAINTENVQLSNQVQVHEEKVKEEKPEPPKTEAEKLSETVNKITMENLIKLKMDQTQTIIFWSQTDTYDIEMEDGTVEQYRRVGVSHREYNELAKIAVEVLTHEDWNTGERFTPKQYVEKEDQWYELQAKYYLRNTKTGKPMSKDELLNCKYSFQIMGILASCQYRSKQGAPEGKK